jgi:hypothetical protein
VLILTGDFKQILPVADSKEEAIRASIFSSPLWKKFKIFLTLKINMRLQDASLTPQNLEKQKKYAQLIKGIGKTSTLLTTVLYIINVMYYKLSIYIYL